MLLVPALAGSDGVCTPEGEALSHCFQTDDGYVVEIVTGPSGEFPVIDAHGNSVFSYLITGPGASGGSCAGVHDVSHADILIPVCDPPFVIIDSFPAIELIRHGHGDGSCGFGAGDTGNDVLKWDFESGCDEASTRSFTIAGVVAAAPTTFLLKAATVCREGTILGPRCDGFVVYCPGDSDCACGNDNPTGDGGCLNSTGNGARLSGSGSSSVLADDLVLHADQLPPNEMVLFLMARAVGDVRIPFKSGLLCLGGPGNKIVRLLDALSSGAAGEASYGPGIVALSCSGTLASIEFCIQPGETWNFQTYYRDQLDGCGLGANTSNGLAVTFF
jgi:hypothetical protein